MKPPQIKRKTFVRWLESQPDDRKFDYIDTENCLICHFFREAHGVEVSSGAHSYNLADEVDPENLPAWLAFDGLEGAAVNMGCREGLRWLKDFLRDQPMLEEP